MKRHQPTRQHQQEKFILVADEDKLNQFAIEKVLIAVGLDSVPTSSAKEVLGLYESTPNRWAAIIISCELEDMNGYTTVKIIREFEIKNNLPPVNIIGTSNLSYPDFSRKAMKTGMTNWLSKPLDKSQLLDMIAVSTPIRTKTSS